MNISVGNECFLKGPKRDMKSDCDLGWVSNWRNVEYKHWIKQLYI